MPLPNAKMKINKDGVKFESSVDKVNYTIEELSRAALKDVARFLKYELVKRMKSELRGMKKSKRPAKAIQTWVRKRETDLQIGFGHSKRGLTGETWYGILQELGSKNHPQKGLLRSTVYDSIPEIIRIESQYLSALESEASALALIDESEDLSDGTE